MAFVLGDLFRSGGSKLFGDPNVVGSINGRDVTRLELSQKMEELRAGNPEQYANTSSVQLANFVWNAIVTDEVLAAGARGGRYVCKPRGNCHGHHE